MNQVLYILMRTDLKSMTTGRAAAQASHASNAFIHWHGDETLVKEWQKQTNQGFGTAIVLGANIHQIIELVSKARKQNIAASIVDDPDYCIKVDQEVYNLIDQNKLNRPGEKNEEGLFVISKCEQTCAFIFGNKDFLENALPQIKLLSLYP